MTADSVRGDQRFNIDTFRSEVHKYGVHNTAHFNLVIHEIPPLLRESNSAQLFDSINKYLMLRVDTTTLPGVSLATQEIVRHGFGVHELRPYAPLFDRINLTAYDDRYGLVYDFFQSWIKLIQNYDLRDSINGSKGFGRQQNAYELTYKEDHAVDISVISYNPQGEEIITVTMREAFPIFLQSIDLGWERQNELVKIQTSFAFTDWFQKKEYINEDAQYNTSSSGDFSAIPLDNQVTNPATPIIVPSTPGAPVIHSDAYLRKHNR